MMGHGIAVLLFAAVAGYWVLERADRHKGSLKQVGQALGWIIIVASLVGAACRVWCMATGKDGVCPFPMKKGGWCPISSSTPAAAPAGQTSR